jgi:uncharacterized DUF497 family protein
MEPIVIWDLDDDPLGNVFHIAEHGISKEEVESVLLDPHNPTDENRGEGDWITFGTTYTGRHIAVIWDEVSDDPEMVYPITAYEVPER